MSAGKKRRGVPGGRHPRPRRGQKPGAAPATGSGQDRPTSAETRPGVRPEGAPGSRRRRRGRGRRGRARPQNGPNPAGPKSGYRQYAERCAEAGQAPMYFERYLVAARRYRAEYDGACRRGEDDLVRELDDLMCEKGGEA